MDIFEATPKEIQKFTQRDKEAFDKFSITFEDYVTKTSCLSKILT